MSNPENRRAVHLIAAELFAERHDHLLRIARHNSWREADAHDALQEAFAAFLATYDPGRGSPTLAWLTLVLKRACWRANESRPLEYEPAALAEILTGTAPDPVRRVLAREDARRRLRALKREERRAVVLHAAGYTYGEIGERCGWTHTKVNRCLYEGRAALREAGSIG
jgi:DNA-directed RNA polymerase specialized sigma24 family protein